MIRSKVVNYGVTLDEFGIQSAKESKVFLEEDGVEIVRFDCMSLDEAQILARILESCRITFLAELIK